MTITLADALKTVNDFTLSEYLSNAKECLHLQETVFHSALGIATFTSRVETIQAEIDRRK